MVRGTPQAPQAGYPALAFDKKPEDGRLTGPQHAFNQLLRGIRGIGERANTLLKTTFKALRRVGLDPSRITRIAAAALVLLQPEYGRTV